jgi:hypothetical protein
MMDEMNEWNSFFEKIFEITPIKWLFKKLFSFYVLLFMKPTYDKVYRQAPWWAAGYSNRESPDICHQLTNYAMSLEFWKREENREICEKLIFSNFRSPFSLLEWIFYIIVLFYIFKWTIRTFKQGMYQVYEISHNTMLKKTREEIVNLRRDLTPSPRKRNELTPPKKN